MTPDYEAAAEEMRRRVEEMRWKLYEEWARLTPPVIYDQHGRQVSSTKPTFQGLSFMCDPEEDHK